MGGFATTLKRRLRRLVHRVGRRGTTLLFLSLVDITVALGLFTIDDYGPSVARYYAGMALLLPLHTWGYVWLATAGLLGVQAFMRNDRVAFAVAALIKQLWACGYLATWLYFGVDRAWISAVIYLAFSFFVLMISGWRENYLPRSEEL